MSAQIEQNQVQGATSSQGAASNNSLMRITIGPTALASKEIYEMLNAYLKIMKEQAQQKNNFYKSQYDEVKSQAKATVKSAVMQMLGLVGSGLMMIAGGLGTLAANRFTGKPEYDKNEKLMNQSKAEMDPLKAIDKVQPASADKVMGTLDKENPVAQRIEDLKAGNFTKDNLYDVDTTEQAIQHMKANDPEGFIEVKRQLNEQITQKTQEMNAYAQKIQGVTVSRQAMSQMSTQISQAAGNVVQGTFGIFKAQQDKDIELNRTAASQAGQGASELGQDMSKQYNNAMQALQALSAIRQSAETSNM